MVDQDRPKHPNGAGKDRHPGDLCGEGDDAAPLVHGVVHEGRSERPQNPHEHGRADRFGARKVVRRSGGGRGMLL